MLCVQDESMTTHVRRLRLWRTLKKRKGQLLSSRYVLPFAPSLHCPRRSPLACVCISVCVCLTGPLRQVLASLRGLVGTPSQGVKALGPDQVGALIGHLHRFLASYGFQVRVQASHHSL